jgi:UDP-N-acetylglucosamine--N-acetylmuramyl-(pentapeptide) pyrophosphoryl-undecaprenol N-acetylglucosamine transferase
VTDRTRPIRLLLSGGGTGGHLFPAVAAAQEFQRQRPQTEVLFVGTRRKVDTRSLAAYGFASETIVSYGLKGKKISELVKALAVLPFSIFQAWRIVRRFRPDLLLAVGGYVTGPVVLAAKLLGIPVVLHEQNTIPGLANRQLGRLADRICLSLPASGGAFDQRKIVLTGNPVRQDILALAASEGVVKNDPFTLAVIGGSQGAQAVNQLVREAVTLLAQRGVRLRLIHQTGEQDAAETRRHYQELHIDAVVEPFFTDMVSVYGQANLLISRAGATALAEISVLGRPVILIPYPYAADNHQEKNGEYYAAGGGAILFRQMDLDGAKLGEVVYTLLADRDRLATMGEAMRKLGMPDAARKIVACCLEIIGSR